VIASSEDYDLDDRPARVDLDVVWSYLSTAAYWARWRTREDVAQQVSGAWRVVGAYRREDGNMVGFARAVSDGIALGYLADVFVLPAHRGRGLGKRLVATMIDEGPGSEFRWLLHTADAHELYAQFGFGSPDATLLERPGTRPATPPSPETAVAARPGSAEAGR
jgi:GNAT superfamily N-acetyltransferase